MSWRDFPKGSGKSSHENKRALSRFYQKIFLIGNELSYPMGILHSFSIKNIYDKIDLKGL